MTHDMRSRIANIIASTEHHGVPEDTAEAIIAALPELQGWQPIETAPRDGLRILVSCVYDVQGERHSWEWVDWWGGDEGQKHWFDFPKEIPAPFPPTHWMPLPAAPAGIAQEGE